jgi:hypothetical protein
MILALHMKVDNMVVTGDLEMVINHIKNKYRIKKEKLKNYAKRACELMDSFNSFNIYFIPRDKNQKVDSLEVVGSLFNLNDSQSQNTFCVKRIFRSSIHDNQDYLQVFENDEHVSSFLADPNDSFEILNDQNDVPISKYCVSLESLIQKKN